jgi:hypothetical protein
VHDRLDDIRIRLEQISDELGDLTIDLLREAVDSGADRRPAEEKPMAQARRAVDKAARHLSSIAAVDVD